MAAKFTYCLTLLLVVGIQLATSVPAYAAGPNYGSVSGPGYSAGASFGGASPYAIPQYGGSPYGPSPIDLQSMFQQYFAALQAQQLAFQRQIEAQIRAQQQAFWDQSNRVDGSLGAPGASSYAGPGSPSAGPQSAFASGSIGPQGGYQAAQISPASPGIVSRFGESVPAPTGGNFGVFSSSSSSSSMGPDGKQVSRKSATVAVNDNGKISVKTVHDP